MIFDYIERNKFYDEQIELVESRIRQSTFGSQEYGRLLDVREKLIKAKHDNTPKIDWGLVIQAVGMLGTALLTYKGYKMMADIAALSYGLDESMALCNGRVFNTTNSIFHLIPKKM